MKSHAFCKIEKSDMLLNFQYDEMDPQTMWRVQVLVLLCASGLADATYQYYNDDQYCGGKRTALTCLLITWLLADVLRHQAARLAHHTGVPILDSLDAANAINTNSLAFVATILSVSAMLLSLFGRRSVFIWNALAYEPGGWYPNQ